MNFEEKDLLILRNSVRILENPNWLIKLTDYVGKPLEFGLKRLPKKVNNKIGEITNNALSGVLKLAINSFDENKNLNPSNKFHKGLTVLSGSVGGAFGLPGLAIELPFSTAIMLRSIADIARSLGEDLNQIETRLNCIQIFAFGGNSKSDDASESGYFAIRTALSQTVNESVKYILQRGLMVEEGAPILVRLISSIASRFSIQVSEKFAVQFVPILGAFGGASINYIFMDHFQKIATAHFNIRNLERIYGNELVKIEYEKIKNENS